MWVSDQVRILSNEKLLKKIVFAHAYYMEHFFFPSGDTCQLTIVLYLFVQHTMECLTISNWKSIYLHFSLLYSGCYLQRSNASRAWLLWWIQRSLAACSPIHCGWGVSLRLWQLAERKDFESDMTLVVMKSVKHLLYFIKETSGDSPQQLSLPPDSYLQEAGSTSIRDLPFCSVYTFTRDSENSQGLESGDRRICLGWYKLPLRP